MPEAHQHFAEHLKQFPESRDAIRCPAERGGRRVKRLHETLLGNPWPVYFSVKNSFTCGVSHVLHPRLQCLC